MKRNYIFIILANGKIDTDGSNASNQIKSLMMKFITERIVLKLNSE